MKRKVRKLYLQPVFISEFLDTPGDEITPGSHKIREDFQNERLRHDGLLSFVQNIGSYAHD